MPVLEDYRCDHYRVGDFAQESTFRVLSFERDCSLNSKSQFPPTLSRPRPCIICVVTQTMEPSFTLEISEVTTVCSSYNRVLIMTSFFAVEPRLHQHLVVRSSWRISWSISFDRTSRTGSPPIFPNVHLPFRHYVTCILFHTWSGSTKRSLSRWITHTESLLVAHTRSRETCALFILSWV